ncbi:interleukin-1 receptor type 2-like [Narcine bancroftii]|uniref:interleukin-1 receptor type 2-like n=1 Tax=Narcine bancroftii TaxID=1343680 RepID=UPI0038323249
MTYINRNPWTGLGVNRANTLLLLLLIHSLTSVAQMDRMKDQGRKRQVPRIMVRARKDNVFLGESLELNCKASTKISKISSIIYWLADNQFIDDRYMDGRVSEGEEKFRTKNEKAFIQKNLKFTQLTKEDFSVNFSCVVLTTMGYAVKNITLDQVLTAQSNQPRIGMKQKLKL